MRTAIVDSGPLINLVHLGLASRLLLFFNTVYVPSIVQAEVNRKHRFRYQLRKLYGTGVFERCRSVDVHNVRLYLPNLDEGEAEALVQAQEKEVDVVVVDEEDARSQINSMENLSCVGTARILARLHRQGDVDDPIRLVRKLRKEVGFRVSDAIVKEAIAMADEPI